MTSGVDAVGAEATLVDVAREAGVSPSTASRVLNGSTRKVLPANAARVRRAADQLGYVADSRAQATVRRQPGAAAIIVDSLTDEASMGTAATLLQTAEGSGMTVTVHVASLSGASAVALVRALRGQRTSAVLIVAPDGDRVSSDLECELARYAEHGGRVQIVDAGERQRTCPSAVETLSDTPPQRHTSSDTAIRPLPDPGASERADR